MPTGQVTLCMQADGRYGQHDFTICPQAYSAEHPHRILVRDRHSPHNSHLDCVWWTPSASNFHVLPNSVFSDLGRCSSARFVQLDALSMLLKDRMANLSATCHGVPCIMLKKLAASMCHAMLLLRFHAYTLREMVIGVAHAQRSYLDALALADFVEFGFHAKLNGSASTVQSPLSHVLGASSIDVFTVNRLQVAGVAAYLIVPHEEELVLGANAVVLQPFHNWQEDGCIKPMPSVYAGSASSTVHDIMTLPPRYATLEQYFLDLDHDFKVVPIGVRGTVITSSLPASKCRPTRSATKCVYIISVFKFELTDACSAETRIFFTGST